MAARPTRRRSPSSCACWPTTPASRRPIAAIVAGAQPASAPSRWCASARRRRRRHAHWHASAAWPWRRWWPRWPTRPPPSAGMPPSRLACSTTTWPPHPPCPGWWRRLPMRTGRCGAMPSGRLAKPATGPCVPPVSRTLADAHPRVRATAAHALGEIDDVRAVDALIGALKDEDPEVREMVAWALGELEQARAVPGLVTALGGRRLAPAGQGGLGSRRNQSAEAVDGLAKALTRRARARARHGGLGPGRDWKPAGRRWLWSRR